MSGAVGHWWTQRISSLALIPLAVWLIWAALALSGLDHAGASAWLGQPFQAFMMVATTAVAAFHAQLGIQVIVEDYIPGELAPRALIFLTRAACLLGTLAVVWVAWSLVTGG